MWLLRIVPFMLLFMLIGCEYPIKTGSADEEKITELNGKIIKLNETIASLEERINRIDLTLRVNEFAKNIEKVVYLTPGSTEYQVIKTDIGALTVAMENIVPYANGSKITLNFGNLTSGTIDGLSAELDWGMVDDAGQPINEKQKSRKVEFPKSLNNGSWTRSDVNLEGIPPSDLGFIRLKNVGHRGIRLRK